MTTAEELRKYADKALKEGGFMYFLGEHLDALASRAEAEQAENEKLRHENERLRKLLNNSLDCIDYGNCESCYCVFGGCTLRSAMRELGIEVES